ncbi:GyrI-like domain-containing protein [Paenibacillus filicis]|uniref:GyrI-like domain-containing protein n=1 Tax=Paenibacillus gyeongsangnamensis TaxID=3388067 RepID=A0ABT4QAQ7_9BACL|nr:GyrI-like domain-containing protein [Paenibacillus filicis]MCZ8513968.1 GyrI-like domain-containing protein [Paenibacillus filicis]
MEARLVSGEALELLTVKAKGSMKHFQLPKDVRRAWHELQAIVERDGVEWTERNIGYVLIPQWITEPQEELELRVGIRIGRGERTPDGTERLHIPARTYALLPCRGDREQMNHAYAWIDEWIAREGLKKDTGDGVFGMEPNRLIPVNPFDIPADTIDRFDYDIMIAVKE